MEDIKIGDVVKLKGGSTKMTAAKILEGEAICIWFEGAKLLEEHFELSKLEYVTPMENTGLTGDESPDNI